MDVRGREIDRRLLVAYNESMTGGEFVRLVSKVGQEQGVAVAFDEKRSKGSHGTLHYGRRKTIVKDRRKEVGAGLLAKMLRDLELTLDDLSRRR